MKQLRHWAGDESGTKDQWWTERKLLQWRSSWLLLWNLSWNCTLECWPISAAYLCITPWDLSPSHPFSISVFIEGICVPFWGNSYWNRLSVFIGRTDADTEAPTLWLPDVKSWLIRKDPDAGKDWEQEKGATEDERLDGITDSVDMNLSKLQVTMKVRRAWHAVVHGVAKCQTWLSDRTTTSLERHSLHSTWVLLCIQVEKPYVVISFISTIWIILWLRGHLHICRYG